MTKYNARRVELDGQRFDSQAEAARYQELVLLERAGAITGLRVHPVYLLEPRARMNGQWLRPVRYIADFEYRENGALVVEDVKGVETSVFRLKANLFKRRYPDRMLRIVRMRRGA